MTWISVKNVFILFHNYIYSKRQKRRKTRELHNISELDSSLYGNPSDTLTSSSRLCEDWNFTYTTCRDCLAEFNSGNYSQMWKYAKEEQYNTWSGKTTRLDNRSKLTNRQSANCECIYKHDTCNSHSCGHHFDPSGLILNEMLSKISEESDNAENSKVRLSSEELDSSHVKSLTCNTDVHHLFSKAETTVPQHVLETSNT